MKYIVSPLIIFFATALLLLSGCGEPKVPGGTKLTHATTEAKLDHLIILEVCNTGFDRIRKVKWGKKENIYYTLENRASYIKLFNPTPETIYLDSLCLMASTFNTNEAMYVRGDITPQDFIKDMAPVTEIRMIPGKGKDYPIKSGETKIIAFQARDFTKDGFPLWAEKVTDPEEKKEYLIAGIPEALDLTNADFQLMYPEWEAADSEAVPGNPNVPALYGMWTEKNMTHLFDENVSILLAKIEDPKFFEAIWDNYTPITKKDPEGTPETYVREYHAIRQDASHSTKATTSVVIPNKWVIDAVNMCPLAEFAFFPISQSLDEGYTWVQDEYRTPNVMSPTLHAGKAVRRLHNGKIYEDNNNSVTDFTIVDASLKPGTLGVDLDFN